MFRIFIVIILFTTPLTSFGQTKMRPLDQLVNTIDPTWPLVQQWIKSAKNKVEVLSPDSLRANEALYNIQLTTRSPMGAIIYNTGGLLVDNGWIRILGSGSEKLNRSLPDWNKNKTFNEFGETAPYLLIADDAIGGFFLLNGGALGEDLGKVYYWAPDNLMYEALDLTYTDFLFFCFNHDLNDFYKSLRWLGWQQDVSKLKADHVFSFFPYLWSKEGRNINELSKEEVPLEEQYILNLDFRKQLKLDM